MSPSGRERGEALFKKNLGALASRFPELAKLVAAAQAPLFEIFTSSSGLPSARLPGGALIHSSRAPLEESRRLAASALKEGRDTAVIFGFGLGYHAEACLEAGARAVIVCELEPGRLAQAFSVRDLGGLLASAELGFVVRGEPSVLIGALELAGSNKAALLRSPALEEGRTEWYEAARRALDRWNAKTSINEATLKRFGRLWVRNLARNFPLIAASPGIEFLEGSARGLPALVLAAGPSLDALLPRLREIRQRVLLIAVDTALRSLASVDVEPDILVLMDPQYWNWRHIGGLSAKNSILVSESAAWPPLFRSEYRAIFLGGSLFPLGKKIESFTGSKGLLGAGGSVATSAWDLARIMGAAQVWMAGLDLGFPDAAVHARASFFEQSSLAEGLRLSPAENFLAGSLLGAQPCEAMANDGGRLRSDRRMLLYAWWFESRLARPGAPPTFSLSPRGLAVPGMVLGRIEELLALPCARPEIDAGLERALASASSADRPPAASSLAKGQMSAARRSEAAALGLSTLRAELKAIADTAACAACAASRGRAALARGQSCRDELAALEKADSAILSNQARELVGFLMPPLEELLAPAAPGDSAAGQAGELAESLARSEALYSSLALAGRYHLDILTNFNKP